MQHLIDEIHANAVDKGFWDFLVELDAIRAGNEVTNDQYEKLAFLFYGKQFMMLSSEISEAMEAVRKQKGFDEVEGEFADIFIRLADLYKGLYDRGLVVRNLEEAIERKMQINEGRERLHGVLG